MQHVPGQVERQRLLQPDQTVVIYQITTYDWGSRQQQRAAYGKLLTTVARAGAKLVFVTSPPIKPDDFYKPYMADLERAPGVAQKVAAGSAGKADFLDAGAVWGGTYQRVKGGKADRLQEVSGGRRPRRRRCSLGDPLPGTPTGVDFRSRVPARPEGRLVRVQESADIRAVRTPVHADSRGGSCSSPRELGRLALP